MRIYVLLIALWISSQQVVFSQTGKMTVLPTKQLKLSVLLPLIEKQNQVVFSYSPDRVYLGYLLNFENEAYLLDDLLAAIALQTGLKFSHQYGKILIGVDSNTKEDQFEKTIQLNGRIVDQLDNPIPFVSVYFKNTQLGVTTDEKGNFRFDNIQVGESFELIVSAIGYVTYAQPISVRDNFSDIEIKLNTSFTELKPVEVSTGRYQLLDLSTGTAALNKTQIEFSPNLIKDVFRNINMIPSVSNTDYSVKPRIRGGDFSETAIYLDGFELINPFHIEIGGGVQGLFNTDYIESIAVYPGTFSSKYTDKTSGIVDLKTNNFFDENEFSISLDLLNSIGAMKLKLSDKLYLSSVVRRGYWDVLIDLEALGASLVFFDTWNKLVYRPTDKHLFEFNFLYGKDIFDYESTNNNTLINHYNSAFDKRYAWVNWKTNFSPKFFRRMTLGYQNLAKSSDFFFQSSISNDNIDDSRFHMFNWNEYFEWELDPTHHLSFGFEYRLINNQTDFSEIRYDVHASTANSLVIDTIAVNTGLKEHLYGIYGEHTYLINNRLTTKTSVRVSGQSFTNRLNIAPRLNIDYKLSNNFNAGVGYGWFYQPDQFYDLRAEIGQSQLSSENQKAIHYTFDLTYKKKNTSVKLDLFLKDYQLLFDDYRFTPTERIETFLNFEQRFGAISGQSRGFELVVNQKYGNHSLNVGYAFARHQMENEEGTSVSRSREIPHSLTINNLFQFKKAFSVSTSFIIRSGLPYSQVSNTDAISALDGLKAVIFYDIANKNNARYANYSTFDVKLAKTWFGQKATFEAYLNFLNLFNTENTRNIYYDASVRSNGSISINSQENGFFPFLITPGLKVTF